MADDIDDILDGQTRRNPAAIQAFLTKHEELRSRGDSRAIAAGTAENYVNFIDSYLAHCSPADAREWGEDEAKVPIVESIEDWLADVGEERDWTPGTKGIAAFAVANYYRTMHLYHIDHKLLPHAQNVRAPEDEFDPKVWTRDELDEMFEYAGTIDHDRIMDALVIGWKCLTRNLELVQLERDDVDLSKPAVTVEGVKGSRTHTFTPEDECLSVIDPCPYSLWDALDNRLDDASERGSEFLFASGDGHVHPDTVSHWFGQKVTTPLYGDWHGTHSLFRHSHVSHLINSGVEVDNVQRFTRHRWRQTTLKYDNTHILNRLD